MTQQYQTLVLKRDTSFEHNMLGIEFPLTGEYWIVCVDCGGEKKVSKRRFESFLERAPLKPDIHLMGVLRYEG